MHITGSAVVLVVLLRSWASAQAPPDTLHTGSIAGRVTEQGTLRPLGKIPVFVSAGGGKGQQAQTETDQSGEFRIDGLAPGNYSVWIAGKQPEQPFRRGGVPSTRVVRVEDSKTVRSDLTRPWAGGISGKIRDESGRPLAGVTVTALVRLGADGSSISLGTSGETREDGTYRIADLAQGRYMLRASRKKSGGQLEFRPAWYPGVDSEVAATKVAVAPGREIEATDITLRAERTFRVVVDTSEVVKAAGDGARILVEAKQVGNEIAGMPLLALSAKGTATLEGLFAGRYRLVADIVSTASRGRIRGSAEVEVGFEETATVALTLDPMINARIQLVPASDGIDLGPVLKAVTASLVSTEGVLLPTRWQLPFEGDGFQVSGVPAGKYLINVAGLPPGFYISSMMAGSVPSDARGAISIYGGVTVTVRVANDAAALSTRTADGDGKVLTTGCTVMVDAASLDAGVIARATFAGCGVSERAVFTGVRPGKYLVFGFDAFDLTMLRDADLLRKYQGGAVQVELSQRQTLLLDIPLIHFQD